MKRVWVKRSDKKDHKGNDTEETGTYIVFDPRVWEEKEQTMTIQFKHLEGRPVNPT